MNYWKSLVQLRAPVAGADEGQRCGKGGPISTPQKIIRAMNRMVFFALVGSPAFLAAPNAQAATTLWVNKDASVHSAPGSSCRNSGYATIQEAINAASAGDTINVCPAVYFENLSINTAHLTIISTNGAAATPITAATSNSVVFISKPGVTFNGFTIIPAGRADGDLGIFVAVEGAANAKILNNVVSGGRIGINLGCTSSSSRISNNVVTGAYEAGINVDTCEADPFPGSSDNTVAFNTVCSLTFPYSIAVGGGTASNNIVHQNAAKWIFVHGSNNSVNRNSAELFDIGPGNTQSQNKVSVVCP